MGSRNTKQKSAIREAFQREGRPLSLEEVFGAAQHSQPMLGLATVYRNIQVMLADGWLRSVEIPGDPVRYELAAQTRHDHFHCSRCSKVYDLEESFAPVTMKVPQGFQTTRQEFVFYGHVQTAPPERAEGEREDRMPVCRRFFPAKDVPEQTDAPNPAKYSN